MQEDPNTDNQTPHLLMDCEDWQIAFQPYEASPSAALSLGFKLAMLRAYLDAQTIKCQHAIDALDLGMEVLFPHTGFYDASFDLFLRYTDGRVTFEEEQMLNALGIKF